MKGGRLQHITERVACSRGSTMRKPSLTHPPPNWEANSNNYKTAAFDVPPSWHGSLLIRNHAPLYSCHPVILKRRGKNVWVRGRSSDESGLPQFVNNNAYPKPKNVFNYKRDRMLLETLIVAQLTKVFFTIVWNSDVEYCETTTRLSILPSVIWNQSRSTFPF